MAERYTFSGTQTLMAAANRPEIQAQEKPLFTEVDIADSDVMGTNTDGDSVALGEVSGHKLVYNEESGTVFGAVTSDYQIINPPEFIGPLAQELTERELNIDGDVYVRNGGGQAFMSILLDTDEHTFYPPGRGKHDPVKAGFNIRWSHDQGLSVQANAMAQDTACTNSIRQVGNPIKVKHTGDVDDRIDWREEWATVLDRLGGFSEKLAYVIEDAQEFDFLDYSGEDPTREFRELETPETHNTFKPRVLAFDPIHAHDILDMVAFYELAGFPTYMAQNATERLLTRAKEKDDPRVLSAWDVHSAATYAITHAFRGTTGASDDEKHKIAAEILTNPQKAIEDARLAARDTAGTGDGEVLIDGDDVDDDMGEALQQYHERSRELEQSFGD